MLILSIYPKARKLFKNQRVTLVKTSKILTTRTKPSFHYFSIRFFLQKKKKKAAIFLNKNSYSFFS